MHQFLATLQFKLGLIGAIQHGCISFSYIFEYNITIFSQFANTIQILLEKDFYLISCKIYTPMLSTLHSRDTNNVLIWEYIQWDRSYLSSTIQQTGDMEVTVNNTDWGLFCIYCTRFYRKGKGCHQTSEDMFGSQFVKNIWKSSLHLMIRFYKFSGYM